MCAGRRLESLSQKDAFKETRQTEVCCLPEVSICLLVTGYESTSLGEMVGSRWQESLGDGGALPVLLVPVHVISCACISWVMLLWDDGEKGSKQFVLSPCEAVAHPDKLVTSFIFWTKNGWPRSSVTLLQVRW